METSAKAYLSANLETNGEDDSIGSGSETAVMFGHSATDAVSQLRQEIGSYIV
jgi:hypothetical protein